MNADYSTAAAQPLPTGLWEAAHAALLECELQAKCDAALALYLAWQDGRMAPGRDMPVMEVGVPGRPAKPLLVPPHEVERRSVATLHGRAVLIHALAHIEFNAINLALDAVYRFRELPDAYYGDWLRVAAEEAYHFRLLRDHLHSLGHEYGDFSAHNGLWEMALKTAGDPLARMALVPRLLEARGLDVTPGMQAKLAAAGDQEAAAILDIILRDEIGHVAIGNRWFRYLCQQRGLVPESAFAGLLKQYAAPAPKPPFNMEARQAAGFSAEELLWLDGAGLEDFTQQLE